MGMKKICTKGRRFNVLYNGRMRTATYLSYSAPIGVHAQPDEFFATDARTTSVGYWYIGVDIHNYRYYLIGHFYHFSFYSFYVLLLLLFIFKRLEYH